MSSSDEELQLAIAQSIQEASKSQTRKTEQKPIVISSDEEDRPPNPSPKRSHKKDKTALTNPSQSEARNTNSSAANTFLSQRAQLEAERLARAKQRMQAKGDHEAPSPLASTSSAQREPAKRDRESTLSNSEEEISHSSNKRLKVSVSNTSNSLANFPSSSSAKPPTQNPTQNPKSDSFFWDGELRQTANAHVERSKDTRPVFRLHDILGEKSDLSFAILSSFVTQVSWIYDLMPQDIPVILLSQPDSTGAAYVHNILPHWVKVTPFLRNGRGCMHVKLLLLFYTSGRLRIVIPTANLVDYDWRDVENSVWLQDVPLRKQPIGHDSKADDFPAQLERVLHDLHTSAGLRAILIDHPHIPLSAITDLREKWDFSRVHAQLVPSIAGRFEGWPAVLRVGHTRLMHAIRQIGARADVETHNPLKKPKNSDKKRKLHLECQTSSIGSYAPPWIEEFYLSACGVSAERWLDEVKTKRSKRLDGLVENDGWRSWKQIQILFPSLNTVRESRLGEDGAGTMFCRRSQWTAPRFPRPLFHDSNSKRGAVLMHTKMILGTFEKTGKSTPKVNSTQPSASSSRYNENSSDNDTAEEEVEVQEVNPEYDTSLAGWLYVGSHNFTPSAWGNLSGTSFTPIMNITNYELGVLIPLKESKMVSEYASWVRPPRKYNGTDEPWETSSWLLDADALEWAHSQIRAEWYGLYGLERVMHNG